jgi:hypothetical protein
MALVRHSQRSIALLTNMSSKYQILAIQCRASKDAPKLKYETMLCSTFIHFS